MRKSIVISIILCFAFMFIQALCLGCASANDNEDVIKERDSFMMQDQMKDNSRVPGEYIVTLSEDGDESVIHEYFGEFDIIEVRKLSKSMFLLRIKNDPGVENIEESLECSPFLKAVQPNFRYRSFQGGSGR